MTLGRYSERLNNFLLILVLLQYLQYILEISFKYLNFKKVNKGVKAHLKQTLEVALGDALSNESLKRR